MPEVVHATLRRRAALAGQSLQDYLLAHLVEEEAGGRAGFEAAAAAVRADRDAR